MTDTVVVSVRVLVGVHHEIRKRADVSGKSVNQVALDALRRGLNPPLFNPWTWGSQCGEVRFAYQESNPRAWAWTAAAQHPDGAATEGVTHTPGGAG